GADRDLRGADRLRRPVRRRGDLHRLVHGAARALPLVRRAGGGTRRAAGAVPGVRTLVPRATAQGAARGDAGLLAGPEGPGRRASWTNSATCSTDSRSR